MIGRVAGLPERVRLVIFDLDGVIYRGAEPVAGAPELVAWLHASGVACPIRDQQLDRGASTATSTRLASMGIAATADEIVTSTTATIEHLRRHAPEVRRVLGVGATGWRRSFASAGLDVVMAGTPGRHTDLRRADRGLRRRHRRARPGLDYGRLAVAMAAVAGGARFIATNADARYPTPAGFPPGAGATVAALATATGVVPDVIGKPAPAMFRAILESSGVAAGRVRGRRRQPRRGRGGRTSGRVRGDPRADRRRRRARRARSLTASASPTRLPKTRPRSATCCARGSADGGAAPGLPRVRAASARAAAIAAGRRRVRTR